MIQMAAAGIGAKMIDSMSGQHRDAVQYRRQREINKENNEFNKQAAARQNAAAAALQRDQQRYNSEQAQVSRLRQAGLNPALLYGGSTSSSSIGSASAASASPSSYTPSGTQMDVAGGLSLGSEMDLQSAQVENMRTNTASQAEDVVSKQITNKYIDSKTNIELLKMLQEYENLRKAGMLSDKDLQWYDETKTAVLDQIRSQIDLWSKQGSKMAAETTFIEDVQTPNVQSGTELNKAKTNTEKTVQNLNTAKTNTEKTVQELNTAKTSTEKTIQALNISSEKRNYAEKALAQSQIKNNTAVRNELLRKYDLDKSESDLIVSALDKMGLDKGFANALLDVFGEFRRETGKGLGEFFSGDNWFNYLSRKYQVDKDYELGKQRNENENYRTDEWKRTNDNGIKQQTPSPDDAELDKKLSNGAPSDAVRTVPSTENANKEWNRKMQYLDERTKILLSDIVRDRYPNWTKEIKDKFKKDFYYARSKKEINDIINRYYNLK